MGGIHRVNRCTGGMYLTWEGWVRRSETRLTSQLLCFLRVYRLHERLVAIRTEYNLRLKAGVGAPVTQVTLQSTQRRPELEDSTLRYLQDLLAWVEAVSSTHLRAHETDS